MKKYADGGLSRRDMPSDLVNPRALPDTPPPRGKVAPKRKMTREEIEAKMKAAGQMGPVSPRKRMDMQGSGPMPRMAKGGKVRGDGVCTKGKTKGRMV
jgi:hypothetical protein